MWGCLLKGSSLQLQKNSGLNSIITNIVWNFWFLWPANHKFPDGGCFRQLASVKKGGVKHWHPSIYLLLLPLAVLSAPWLVHTKGSRINWVLSPYNNMRWLKVAACAKWSEHLYSAPSEASTSIQYIHTQIHSHKYSLWLIHTNACRHTGSTIDIWAVNDTLLLDKNKVWGKWCDCCVAIVSWHTNYFPWTPTTNINSSHSRSLLLLIN